MTRTNREREALRYACDYLSIISLHVPIFLLLKGVVMFSDYFGGMRAALLQEKNAGDYIYDGLHTLRRQTTTLGPQARDENADSRTRTRGRATLPTSDAVAAP